MSQEPANPDPALEEQLVAYLDGELDAQASRRIEDLLATDPAVRTRLQSLERTWDLLGELETSPAGEEFTRSTLEVVAVAAARDVAKQQSATPRRRRALLSAGFLAAALAGFLVVAMLPDFDRPLLQDLPALENFDEYRLVEDVKFLRELHRQQLFPEPEAPAGGYPHGHSRGRRGGPRPSGT